MTSLRKTSAGLPHHQISAGVLVIGDVMLDTWTYTRFTKPSPEASVDVVGVTKVKSELGGAANAFHHTEDLLPGRNFLLGVIGDDYPGEVLESQLNQFESRASLFKLSGRVTTVKNRLFVGENQLVRIDQEKLEPLTEGQEHAFQTAIVNVIPKVRCILFSDYGKGSISPALVSTIHSYSSQLGIPTVADPAIGKLETYAGITVIKPNALEWATYIAEFHNESDALQTLWDAGTKYVLVTHGKKGMELITPRQRISVRDSNAVAVDVTGAGDVIAASVAVLIARKMPLTQSLDLLLAIGSLAVTYPGTNADRDTFADFRRYLSE